MPAVIKQCSCEHVGMDRVCWDREKGVGDEGVADVGDEGDCTVI